MIASASITITNITDGITTFYQYAKNTSNTVAPTTGWSTNMPSSEPGKFIWRREAQAFSIDEVDTWGNAMCLTGAKGDTGSAGAVGQGVESIVEEYYLSTSKTVQTGGSWVTDPPTWSTGKYMWTRSKITYKNPTDIKYTTPFCDNSWEAVNVVKDELNTIENHYGYKYFADITVYGDSDKLYPVIIKGGNQGIKRDIFVRRGYSELAPPDWNTSTHKGDLVVKIKCNFGGWGGANYSWEIHELEEMYSRTFAGCLNVMSNMAFAIFLRGGGTTGAIYHLYSNQSLTTEKYGYPSPQICYNSELIGVTGEYSWNAPAPKTFKTLKPDSLQDSDQQAIDVRNFIPLSKKSVKSTDVEYYLSTSSTSLSGGAWQTTAPDWVDGKYMWSRTKTTLNDGTVNYTPSTNGTCIAGATGATGAQGPQGVQGPPGADGSSLYTWVAYANDAVGTGISASPTGKTYIGFAYNKATSTMTLTPGLFTWAKIEGPQGTTGATGATLYTWLKYADTPTTGMSDSPTGKNYIGLAYNKATATESTNYGDYTWSLIKGEQGEQGPTGATGATGKGVSSITMQFYLSTSRTTQTGGSWLDTAPQWTTGKFIWTRSKITYINPSDTKYTTPVLDYSFDAVNDVDITGKNLVIREGEIENTGIDTSGNPVGLGGISLMATYISVKPGETYRFTKSASATGDGYFRYRWLSESQTYIGRAANANNTFTWVVPENTYYLHVSYPSGANVKIEKGSTATPFSLNPIDRKPPVITSNGLRITIKPGLLYINGIATYIRYYTRLLTNTGSGYITISGSEINIAKMQPEDGYIKWVDYDTPATTVQSDYIFGRFEANETNIYNLVSVEPASVTSFTKSHFMDILADRDMTDIGKWTEALGVTQFFQSLAVWDLFADSITTNNLIIDKMVNGKQFKFIISTNEGQETPIIQAFYDNELVFQINPDGGDVFVKGTGEFNGTIEHESLKTQEYAPGNAISLTATNKLWNAFNAYNSGLTSLSYSQTIQPAAGSYAGKSFNGATRLYSGQGAIIGSYAQPNSYYITGDGEDRYYKLAGIYTVPSGANKIAYSYNLPNVKGRGYCHICKNPHSDFRTLGITAYYPHLIGTQLYSSLTTGVVSGTVNVQAGDVIAVWVSQDRDDFDQEINSITLKAISSAVGSGIFLRYTDGTYGVISSQHNIYRDDVLTFTSPQSWSSSSNLVYKKGTDLYDLANIQSLAVGVSYAATGSATIYPLGGGSETYTVTAVRRNPTSVTFETTGTPVTVENWDGQGSSTGVYLTISVSITLVGQARAVKVSSILPKNNEDGQDSFLVGSGTEKFTAGNFVTVNATTLNGNVNSSGTSYKVWGAVAN